MPPCFLHTENDWSARSLGRHHVFLITRTHGSLVRSGGAIVLHPESSWITRPLGCHHVFLTTRTHGSLVRSGATLSSAPSDRLDNPSARVPPCFSHYENAWIARPLGCHRGFRTLRTAGLRARSGATMFLSLRERMDRSSARVPPWFLHPESGWITRPLGCHHVFLTTRTHASHDR